MRGGAHRLGDEPRLAEPGGPDDGHDATLAPHDRVDVADEPREFCLATEQRERVTGGNLPRTEFLTDAVDDLWLRLPLEDERTLGCRVVERSGVFEDRRMGVNDAGAGGDHDPRGGVDGVAHDREDGLIRCAEFTGEDVAAMDPDVQREWCSGIDDRPSCPQHATLVVLTRERHTGAAEQLAAVRVDVHVQQRDVLGFERPQRRGQRVVERFRERVRTVPLEPLIGALELEEGHRRDPVDRVGRSVLEQGRDDRRRDLARCCCIGVTSTFGGDRRNHAFAPPQQKLPVVRGMVASGPSRAAVASVTTIWPASAAVSACIVSVVSGPATTSWR